MAGYMTAMAAPVSAEGAATVGYRVYGYGPRRVLALHGLFGDGMSFTPMLSGFDPEQASFAFIDARGFGRSASLAGPYTLLTIAHDALAVADRLGWDRFSVMGQSMGGKAAIRLALAAPARVERIIGLAPIWAAPVPFEDAALARFRSSASNLDARAEIIAGSTGNRLPTCWSREIARAFFSSSHIEACAGYLESFAFDDFAAEAAELDHPMLVVVGRHDLATTRMAHDGWRKMRRAEIVLLDECGHYPHVEVPLIAAALVGNFLDCEGSEQ